MINVSRIYAGHSVTGDTLRYGEKYTGNVKEAHHHFPDGQKPKTAAERRPVVVWNVSKRCNLKCIHCYTDSDEKRTHGELTFDEACKMIDDLAEFKIPALLLSGGEPLLREDIFELAEYAVSKGIKPVLSTNGTLITTEVAERLKKIGFTYVGISLDGIGPTNDHFRGVLGAFDRAMRGFKACVEAEQRVGLRLTLTRHTYKDLDAIFDFLLENKINRACFYHLVYSGRGKSEDDLNHGETREAMDIICRRTKEAIDSGVDLDILTVDNHADAPYIYMKVLRENPERAEEIRRLLEWNGGGANSTGIGIGNIDWNGNVHPNQFWQDKTFGNVKERKFGDIWMDTSDDLMKGLKNRLPLLKGRCGKCKFLRMCGGALRVRAFRTTGDPWAPDPACYLSDEEIGLE
ncbi:MAG: radical SAM protein [Candidatus Riflebacteria bacterium]|nr:radical SAM protein [Candidatus Riflebacteria bacterium]